VDTSCVCVVRVAFTTLASVCEQTAAVAAYTRLAYSSTGRQQATASEINLSVHSGRAGPNATVYSVCCRLYPLMYHLETAMRGQPKARGSIGQGKSDSE
jgi:hypothetical protein